MLENGREFKGGLIEFFKRFKDDQSCRQYLESKRWPNGPVCPHCGNCDKVYTLNGKTQRAGLRACAECRKQFTVTIGTIFEDSHIPLQKWFAAIHLMCTSKKGISAHQIHRELGITYKSAWFMCHRIRHAMRLKAFKGVLSGNVEVDETYVGGKSHGKRGRGATGKSIVFSMVERGGNIRAQRVDDVKKSTLQPIVHDTVTEGSRICSDELNSYRGLSQSYSHDVVKHAREYVAGKDIHINTAESFFALLKRGVHGTFHHIDRKMIDMYCGEFGFRFNLRSLSDADRFVVAITNCDGRLRWNFSEAKN
jgi:transposase-like protein